MTADDLAPCDARSSGDMVLTYEKGRILPALWVNFDNLHCFCMEEIFKIEIINLLWPRDTKRWHRSWSQLVAWRHQAINWTKKKKKHIHVVYGRGWSHWPTIPFLFGWYTSQTSLIIILYPALDPATFCCFSRLRSYFRPTASSSWRGNALGFPKPQIMGSPWPP